MELCSGDAHGLVPFRLCNEMSLLEIQNENKTTIFFLCKIFCFFFDLMIHCVLQTFFFGGLNDICDVGMNLCLALTFLESDNIIPFISIY